MFFCLFVFPPIAPSADPATLSHITWTRNKKCVWPFIMCLSVAPRGDLIHADLFSCCLICQTRSKDLVTFYRASPRRCLRCSQTRRHAGRADTPAFISLLQSYRRPPASPSPPCPSYKVIEFHGTAAATSDCQTGSAVRSHTNKP